MRSKDVQIGAVYIAKVSRELVRVKILSEHHLGGWAAVNTRTKRKIRIKTAARLRTAVALPYRNAPPPTIRIEMVREEGKPLSPHPRVDGPDMARAVAASILQHEAQEVMLVLLLDTKHRVIATHEISRGTLDAAMLHPREVFRAAIMLPCAGIILAHNHPSGETGPSEQDISVTRRIEKAGKLLGIPLLDHIIVGHGKTLSMKDDGIGGTFTC